MDTILAISIGLGLAAACGFRVFVPLLAASVGSNAGHLTLAPGFDWIGSPVAMSAFEVATLLEVGAYYVPWLDHALDVIATPAAVLAGMLASASVLVDMSPMLTWSVVLIGGGGIAGLTQGATVALRVKSGLFTGGLGNAAVSTAELLGATAMAILAIALPLLALMAVFIMLIVSLRVIRRFTGRRRAV
jgi:hypothetical protein